MDKEMNIIEAYIKHFGQLIILIIGLPTSNKSEIAKELKIDIKPSFTLININDYMNGFIEKEINGIKYKLYDYPDNINWDKLFKDVEDKKSTGIILYLCTNFLPSKTNFVLPLFQPLLLLRVVEK